MADVRVDVELDTKKAVAEAENFKGKMSSAFGDIAKIAGGILTAGAVNQLGGFFKTAVEGAVADEAATKRLEQTFRNYASMVGASAGTFEALNGLLNERIKIGQDLAFTDDQVRDSFNSLLTATDDSTEATKRQTLAFDLARGANIPLEQATKLLGKITAENVEVFKRMGITIGENATEADALAAVQARFGGQAEAYAKSTAGQFEQAKIKMQEVQEQIGAQLLPVLAKLGSVLVEDVIPKIEQFANAAGPKIREFVQMVKPYLQEFAAEAQIQFAKFQHYWETDLKPAFENIKAGVQAVAENIRVNWDKIGPVVKAVGELIIQVLKNLQNAFEIVIDLLQGDWAGAWNNTKELLSGIMNSWKIILEGGMAAIELFIAISKDIGKRIIQGLWEGSKEFWDSVLLPWLQSLPALMLHAIGDLGSLLWSKGKDLIQGLVNGMKSVAIPNPASMIPGVGGLVGLGASILPLTGGGGGGGAAPTGAYGQSLVWDSLRQAWVYPGSEGSHGNAQTGYGKPQLGSPGGLVVNIENFNGSTQADMNQTIGSLAFGLAAKGIL